MDKLRIQNMKAELKKLKLQVHETALSLKRKKPSSNGKLQIKDPKARVSERRKLPKKTFSASHHFHQTALPATRNSCRETCVNIKTQWWIRKNGKRAIKDDFRFLRGKQSDVERLFDFAAVYQPSEKGEKPNFHRSSHDSQKLHFLFLCGARESEKGREAVETINHKEIFYADELELAEEELRVFYM